MSKNNFVMPPIKVGEETKVSGPGGTLTIKRCRRSAYHLWVENQTHHRWADNREQAEEDVCFFLNAGRLPHAKGDHWQ